MKKISNIGIGGPVGVGKTTFCKKIQDRYGCSIIREIPDDQNHLIHKFLEEMYNQKDTETHLKDYAAYAFQTYMLGYRITNPIWKRGKKIAYDRTFLEDRFFANKLIKNELLKQSYNHIWDYQMRELYEQGKLPELYIILDSGKPGQCLKNILKRGRSCEIKRLNDNREYFNELEREYTDYLIRVCNEYNIPYIVYKFGEERFEKGIIECWEEQKI